MKQVLTSINDLRCSSRFNGMKLSKMLFLFCLAAFAVTNSGFKKEIRQSSVDKASPLKKAVPFKGYVSVSLGEGGTSGTGVGSHIGRFEYSSVDDFSQFPFVTGTAVITAANGDQIFTAFSGNLDDIGNGMVNVNFENIITGGTGRFADATGSFTNAGTASLITATANTNFTGTISY
jgi:hypothetical protein